MGVLTTDWPDNPYRTLAPNGNSAYIIEHTIRKLVSLSAAPRWEFASLASTHASVLYALFRRVLVRTHTLVPVTLRCRRGILAIVEHRHGKGLANWTLGFARAFGKPCKSIVRQRKQMFFYGTPLSKDTVLVDKFHRWSSNYRNLR